MTREEEIIDLRKLIAGQVRRKKTRSGLSHRLKTIVINQLREETMFKETANEERWRNCYSEIIRRHAGKLAEHTETLAYAVRNLAALPPFETAAEEEVEDAINKTTEALSSMHEARAGLIRKRRYMAEAAE